MIKPYEDQARQNQVECGIKNKNNLANQSARNVEILPHSERDQEPEIIDITPEQPEQSTRATDMAAKDWGVSGRSWDGFITGQSGRDKEPT